MELLIDFLPFLAITQEIVSATILALDPLLSSTLHLLFARARTSLALLLLWFLDDLDHLDSSPRRTPFDLHCHTFFLILIFKFFGPLSTSHGPVSSTINLQTLGHCDGSL